MCIRIDCAFPPLTIVLHMTFEQHILLIIIKNCGVVHLRTKTHIIVSLVPTDILLLILILKTVTLSVYFFEFFPFDVIVSKFILPKIFSDFYFFTTKLVHIRAQTSYLIDISNVEISYTTLL